MLEPTQLIPWIAWYSPPINNPYWFGTINVIGETLIHKPDYNTELVRPIIEFPEKGVLVLTIVHSKVDWGNTNQPPVFFHYTEEVQDSASIFNRVEVQYNNSPIHQITDIREPWLLFKSKSERQSSNSKPES